MVLENPFVELKKKFTRPGTPSIMAEPEPEIMCQTCKDKGFVVIDLPANDPDFGKSWPCRCTLQKLQVKRWDRSGVSAEHLKETFKTFEQRKGTVEALSAAQALRDGKVQLVILTGNCGSGKTHLAHAVVIHALEMGGSAKIIRAADWLDDLKRAIAQDQRSRDNDTPTAEADMMREQVNRVPVLAIDELKYRTKFDEETIDNLITRRLVDGLRTIITSNSGPEDLRLVFPRVVSRARDPRYGRCVWSTAGDYREELAKKEAKVG